MLDEVGSANASCAGRMRSESEREERRLLGLEGDAPAVGGRLAGAPSQRPRRAAMRSVHAPDVLNEATAYDQPASFSRGLAVEVPAGARLVFLSGTASVGSNGETLYPGDFRAQCWRTYRNLTRLLEASGATWHDVVRCACYLQDIERDYEAFNEVRTELFTALGLDPLPASTAIQARLCRSDLLVEIEVQAVVMHPAPAPEG